MKNLINILVVTFTLCCSSCADLDIASDGRVSLNDIFNRYERTSAYYSNCLGYMPQVGFTYEIRILLWLLFVMKPMMQMTIRTDRYPSGIKDIRLLNIIL